MKKTALNVFLFGLLWIPSITPTAAQPPARTDTAAINASLKKAGVLLQTTPDSAFRLMNLSLQQSKQAGYHEGMIEAHCKIADFFMQKTLYTEAMTSLKQALDEARPEDSAFLARIYYKMANLNQVLGSYDAASKQYYSSLQYKPNAQLKADIMTSLSALYIMMGQSTQAMECLQEVERYARLTNNDDMLGRVLLNKSQCYSIDSQWTKSNAVLDSARLLAQRTHNSIIYFAALVNLGYNHLLLKRPEPALRYLKQAVAIDSLRNPLHELAANRMIGQAYFQLNRYEEAATRLNSTLHKAAQLKHQREVMLVHHLLASLYERTGDFKQALQHAQLHQALSDSLSNVEVVKNTNQMEIKYQTAEKDKHIMEQQLMISEQQNVLKRKNTWLILLSAGGALITALFFALYFNHRNKRKLQDSKIRILEQEQRIDRLSAVVAGEEKERERIARELHDGVMVRFSVIKMNLSVLPNQHNSLEKDGGFGQLMSQLDTATHELRRTAHNLMPDMLIEKGLPEAVSYFCQSLPVGQSLTITYQQFGEFARLSPDFELIVYRMIQELVQNIVKHAQASEALVQLNCMNNLLCITIEDNGRGIAEEALEQSNGMGLKTIRNRVKVMNGTFELSTRHEGGTSVYIEFDTTHLIRQKTAAHVNTNHQSDDHR